MKSILIALLILCATPSVHASAPAPEPDTLVSQEWSVDGFRRYRTGDRIGLRVASAFGPNRRYSRFRPRFVKMEDGCMYVCRANEASHLALAAGHEPPRMHAIPLRKVKSVVERDDDWELKVITGNGDVDILLCLLFPFLIPFAIGIAVGKSVGRLFSPNKRYPVSRKPVRALRSKTETE